MCAPGGPRVTWIVALVTVADTLRVAALMAAFTAAEHAKTKSGDDGKKDATHGYTFLGSKGSCRPGARAGQAFLGGRLRVRGQRNIRNNHRPR